MRKVIAIDLDGTLAYYDHWRGEDHIGDPIFPMVAKVEAAMLKGYTFVIFTARLSGSKSSAVKSANLIAKWMRKHNLPIMEITAEKRKEFIEFWDDRAIPVYKNSGQFKIEGISYE